MINLRRFRDRCTPPAMRARFWKWSEVSPASICSILKSLWPIRDGMLRVTWQPSNAHRKGGSDRSCQRRTRRSGDSPCSKKISLPPGLKTRSIPSRASSTPGIVHSVKVLTTVSTLASAKGIHHIGTGAGGRSITLRLAVITALAKGLAISGRTSNVRIWREDDACPCDRIKAELGQALQLSVFRLRPLQCGLPLPERWQVLGELRCMSGRLKPLPGNAQWRR
jgi:hypothetical protein